MKKYPLILLALALLSLPLIYIGAEAATLGRATTFDFDAEVTSSQVPVLIEFEAKWCPYCRKMQPLLEKLHDAGAYGMKVVQVDIDAEPLLAQEFEIAMLPTLMVAHKGKLIDRHDGAMKEEELFKWAEAAAAAAKENE